MKTPRHSTTARGFTLAEVTIAMGIAAGVLAILTMLMRTLSRDVQRLKPYEAWKRPAFVANSTPSSSSSSSTSTSTSGTSSTSTGTGTPTSTTPTTPTTPINTLPDANLDPSKRPSESVVPPDPDNPTTPAANPSSSTPNTGGTGTTSGTSGTSTP